MVLDFIRNSRWIFADQLGNRLEGHALRETFINFPPVFLSEMLILFAVLLHRAEHSFLGFFPDLIQPHFLPNVNPISKFHCGSYFGNLLEIFSETHQAKGAIFLIVKHSVAGFSDAPALGDHMQ